MDFLKRLHGLAYEEWKGRMDRQQVEFDRSLDELKMRLARLGVPPDEVTSNPWLGPEGIVFSYMTGSGGLQAEMPCGCAARRHVLLYVSDATTICDYFDRPERRPCGRKTPPPETREALLRLWQVMTAIAEEED